MKICNDILITEPVTYIPEPIYVRLTKTPSEIQSQIALDTAKRINLEILENSLNRSSITKQNTYSRSQLDEFALLLGGSVKKNKEELILFIKNKVKEIFSQHI